MRDGKKSKYTEWKNIWLDNACLELGMIVNLMTVMQKLDKSVRTEYRGENCSPNVATSKIEKRLFYVVGSLIGKSDTRSIHLKNDNGIFASDYD